MCVCVCVCVCEREREKERIISYRQTYIYIHTCSLNNLQVCSRTITSKMRIICILTGTTICAKHFSVCMLLWTANFIIIIISSSSSSSSSITIIRFNIFTILTSVAKSVMTSNPTITCRCGFTIGI